MSAEEGKPHGELGYVTRVHGEQEESDDFRDRVGLTLEALVPQRIWELRAASAAELTELAKKASGAIGSRGDRFQFPDGRKGSGVLSELVTGFAAAARLADGGITALGVHACFYEHEGCPKNKDR